MSHRLDLRREMEEREGMLEALPHNGTTERAALRVLLVESIANLRSMLDRELDGWVGREGGSA